MPLEVIVSLLRASARAHTNITRLCSTMLVIVVHFEVIADHDLFRGAAAQPAAQPPPHQCLQVTALTRHRYFSHESNFIENTGSF